MSDARIPRQWRGSLLEDPDAEAKLAAFRARHYGRPGAPPPDDGTGAYLDYERAMPQPSPRPLPEPRFTDMPTDGPLGPATYEQRRFMTPTAEQQQRKVEIAATLDALNARARSTAHTVGSAVAAGTQAVGSDLWAGVKEAPAQALGGIVDAVHSTARALDPIVDWLDENVARLPRHDLPDIAKPETVTGVLTRDTARFLTGFIPALRVARRAGLSGHAAGTLAAGATDALTKDPHEADLITLLAKHPVLGNAVPQAIADYAGGGASDSEFVARLRKFAEGAGLAAPAAIAFSRAVHLIASARAHGTTVSRLLHDAGEGATHVGLHKALDKGLHMGTGDDDDAAPHAP